MAVPESTTTPPRPVAASSARLLSLASPATRSPPTLKPTMSTLGLLGFVRSGVNAMDGGSGARPNTRYDVEAVGEDAPVGVRHLRREGELATADAEQPGGGLEQAAVVVAAPERDVVVGDAVVVGEDDEPVGGEVAGGGGAVAVDDGVDAPARAGVAAGVAEHAAAPRRGAGDPAVRGGGAPARVVERGELAVAAAARRALEPDEVAAGVDDDERARGRVADADGREVLAAVEREARDDGGAELLVVGDGGRVEGGCQLHGVVGGVGCVEAEADRRRGAGRGREGRVAVEDGDVESSWWLGGVGAEEQDDEEEENYCGQRHAGTAASRRDEVYAD
nr:unnamed protein product [Digitaria exilis]